MLQQPPEPEPPGDGLAGLRIGVDARARSERGTGVSTYAAALAQTLQRRGARVERLTDGAPIGSGPAALLRRWSAAGVSGMRPLAWRPDSLGPAWSRPDLFREAQVHFSLHGRLLEVGCQDPPSVMHWTYPLPLILRGARNVYTIHDTIPLDQPELTGIRSKRHQRLLDEIAAAADAIVTVSEQSRARLEGRLAGSRAPIVNTYQTALTGPPFEPPLPMGLETGGYLLFLGSVEPRKNLGRLIAAHRASGVDLPLVIAGPDGWRARGQLKEVRPASSVIRLPWIERPLLTALLRNARALLFPSLAEGFGLPILEAMALGVPALTSNIEVAIEIAGEAALAVDPYDVDALARAIAALTSDAGLRDRLRRAGLERARRFDERAYADRLALVYALARRPR